MSDFARKIYKAIGEYRTILRRNLSQAERMIKLDRLNLKVKLNQTTDIEFYRIAENIILDARASRRQEGVSYYTYQGAARFADYLADMLKEYKIYDGRVIHTSQLASRAYLQAVQLLALDEPRLDASVQSQIQRDVVIIAEFGDEEEVRHLYSVLKQRKLSLPHIFCALFRQFQNCLQQHARMLRDPEVGKVA